MAPQNFVVRVLRPQDLLELLFEFIQVNFTGPQGGSPGTIKGGAGAYLIVYFQPQNIAEEAFFETAEGVGDPGDPGSEFPSPPGAVRSLLSGPSRLVFAVPSSETIEYSLTGLLEALTRLPLQVSPLLTYGPDTGCLPLNQLLKQLKIPAPPPIVLPKKTETAIEAPYRVILSPDNFSLWQHSPAPVTLDALTELWHTRLSTTHRDGRARLRAIWSPDFSPTLQPFENLPFRMSLTARDRNEFVHLTSNYKISNFWPDPVTDDRLMLTTLGAWLRVRGDWQPPAVPLNPPDQQTLTVEQWRHIATMGRDHYVRVVYAGYLFPFGHRASLVKVTERKFFLQEDAETPGVVAYLFQRFFIMVREPTKTYTNRDVPFRTVNLITEVTPNLNDPNDSEIGGHGQEAFWPQIRLNQQDLDFQFHLTGLDWEGRVTEFTAPLIFISQSIDNSDAGTIIAHYSGLSTGDARRNRPMGGQSIAFAPHKKPGDTSLETSALTFSARSRSSAPHFLPTMEQADVDIPAVKQLLGKNQPATIAWEASYKNGSGSQDIGNKADIFARLVTTEALNFATEKVGGMVAPDIGISALSRAFGPTGGDAQKMVDGAFNPLEIFDPNAVKLFGGISLGDIIKDLVFNNAANVGDQIPGLTTERDGDIFRTKYTWSLDKDKLVDTGLFVPNPGAAFTLSAVMETPINGGTPAFTITGELTQFSILLLPTPEAAKLVRLDFNSARFVSEKDKKLDVEVDLGGVAFLGILEFVAQLKDFIPSDGFSAAPSLEILASPPGVEVGFSLGIPTISIGVMTIQNVSLAAAFYLPFGQDPMNFHFAFCERQQPFILTVYIFGGGGFFAMDVGSQGVVMIEAALEFGVSAAINLGVASGEASMMAGFYFQKTGADFILTGYFRAYGSLSVLGIITVSLEFYLGLTYASKGITPHGGTLWGQASLTVKIEILFFSTSVSVSMEKEFAGSDPMFREMLTPADWTEYTAAFAAYP